MDSGKGDRAWPLWLGGALGATALLGLGGLIWYIATVRGGVAFYGETPGPDFASFWAAGRLAVQGRLADIYDVAAFNAAQQTWFGPTRTFAFFSYPPPALLLFAPFGAAGYLPALWLWLALGAAGLVAAARRRFSWSERGLLLLSPAGAGTIVAGQSGFLTAALLLAALDLIERRPRLAGALCGLLVLKPQLALLLPLALTAERRWTVIGWSAASGAAICALSFAVFGPGPWRGFLGESLAMQGHMLNAGRGWFQMFMPTVVMSGRLAGWPLPLAWSLQALAFAAGAVLVWRAWRSSADRELKLAALLTATVFASPQVFHYDLVAFSAAMLILARRDAGALGRGLALVGWLLPAAVVLLHAFNLPLTPLASGAIALRTAWLCEASARYGAAGARKSPRQGAKAEAGAT